MNETSPSALAQGWLTGFEPRWPGVLAGIVVLVGVVNAVLAIPAVRVVAWALPEASAEGAPPSSSTVVGWR